MDRPTRIAIIGAGPAGVYAAGALLAADIPVSIDVFERLPAPYGLVRYGVAPDHPKLRAVSTVLGKILAAPSVRFFGNVLFPDDLSYDDISARFDATIFATGAPIQSELGIAGEKLPGSFGADEFIGWYNAHPDQPPSFVVGADRIAVIGAGNVALDVARMLLVPGSVLATTDVPESVLAAVPREAVTDVFVLARRGPRQAKFTTPELREMAEIPDTDIRLDPSDLPTEDADDDRRVRRNLAVFEEWAQRQPTNASRRVHFKFWQRPTEIRGQERVREIQLERTTLDSDGRLATTGEREALAVGAVLRAAGYESPPIAGIGPGGPTAHRAGRVVDNAGEPIPGRYLAGWVKRGPSGVIGTNRSDAAETVRSLLADAADLPPAANPDPDAIPAMLAARGVDYVSWPDWNRLDAREIALGEPAGRPRVKIADRAAMLEICRKSE